MIRNLNRANQRMRLTEGAGREATHCPAKQKESKHALDTSKRCKPVAGASVAAQHSQQ